MGWKGRRVRARFIEPRLAAQDAFQGERLGFRRGAGGSLLGKQEGPAS